MRMLSTTQPAHVHSARYLSQTLLAALAHGLPTVVIPVSADQPANAERVAALGLGRVVGPGERTPAGIRAAARAVLGDPAYHERARRFRAEMEALPGIEHGVALLERLAVETVPVPAVPSRP